MLRVLYDSQKFDEQLVGGATRYWSSLVAALAQIPGWQPILAVRATANVYVEGTSNWLVPARWINRSLSVRLLKGGRFDVFHPTYYNPYFLNYLGDKPYVVTVFDMIHERLPEYFSAADTTRAWKTAVVRRAAAVVAISECTRGDLLELLNVPAEKVAVVPLATALGQVAPTEISSVPERFVLYVGQRGKYKNFLRLVRALSPRLRTDGEIQLVCAGGGQWRPEEQALFAREGITARVQQHDVSDAQLAYLYREASLLVYPSLYEGFGLPVVEAFACGCPVAASSAGALPEVGGEAAVYFEPGDEASMRGVLEWVLAQEAVRRRLAAAGRERAQLFSWERAAQQTAAVYERVA